MNTHLKPAEAGPHSIRSVPEETYEEFRDAVRRLALERIAPHAAEIDRTKALPVKTLAAFREIGLTGLPYDESLGGQDGNLMFQIIAVEEVSRVCASSGLTLMTSWAALDPLVRFGPPALVQQVLPNVISGTEVAAWCLTEPQGGSDLPALKTQAVPDGEGWRINGVKRFITNATWAEWYLVLAKTGEKSFGIFMVHRDDPGISFGELEKKMGQRGSPTADVNFDDCRIPAGREVGDTRQGYQNMMVSLTISRPMVAALALGIAQGALDEAVKYVKERKQFGQTLARFQMLRGMIADMVVKIESSRALLYKAVETIETDPNRGRHLASMAKMLCSDTAMSVATDAVQLHGGYGYLEDYPVERMMRDAKITQIFEGTNQIQRLIIAKTVLQD